MLESEENKEYLPIQGLEAFNKATAELLLGADNAAIKVPMCIPLCAVLRTHRTLLRMHCVMQDLPELSCMT